MRSTLNSAGFSLIEMAIVLAVLSVIGVAAIQITTPVLDGQRAAQTRQRMDMVQKALQLYVIRFGCLPCPAQGTLATGDANAGRSMDATPVTYTTAAVHCTSGTTDCLAENTTVPWKELGLSEADATDAWQDRFRYFVANGTPCTAGAHGLQSVDGMVRCTTASFPAGGVSVDDTDVAGGPEITNAAYVLISSGPDRSLALPWSGVLTADRWAQLGGGGAQEENADDDDVFATGSFNGAGLDTHFDDIVKFTTAPIMMQLCGTNACGNPA